MKISVSLVLGCCLLHGTAHAGSDLTYGVGVEILVAKPSLTPTQIAAKTEQVYKIFNDVNLLWQPIGISLQPIINFRYDPDFALMDDFNGDMPNTAAEAGTALGLYNDILSDFNPPTTVVPILLLSNSPSKKCGAGGADDEYVADADFMDTPHIFCGLDWAWNDTATLSHELGHYFCLPHTFTFQDPATHDPVSHDGDQISDTYDDPGLLELCGSAPGNDYVLTTNSSGACVPTSTPVPEHEWCVTSKVELDPAENVLQWSNGKPKTHYCTVDCFMATSNGTVISTAYTPLPQNNESYYGGCSGPYVIDGEPYYSFTQGQAERVNDCLGVDDLVNLTPLCVGDGDSDSDGLCDDEDPCPDLPKLDGLGTDDDGDGLDDACDVCLGVPGAGVDSDGDKVCDQNDPDDDNDSCLDGDDNDPTNGLMLVGYQIGDNCFQHVYGPASGDTDGDGYLDCDESETDSDNDGIPNGMDLCPVDVESTCMQRVFCPLPERWFLQCRLGDCNEFFVKLVKAINPDPTREIVFERIEIVNQALYLRELPGKTALETAYTLAGETILSQSLSGEMYLFSEPERLRLELWSRRSNERVAIIAEYEPSAARFEASAWGDLVEVLPSALGDSLVAGATWAVGLPSGQAPSDRDRDSFPDPFDNCSETYNPAQADTDGDGYGNLCDPDLDGDRRVSDYDRALLTPALDTAPLQVSFGPFSYAEGFWVERPIYNEPPAGYEATADFFADADLDGNQRIDAVDLRLLEERLGRLPGPSGLAP